MIQKSNQKVLSLLMLFMLALTGSMEVKGADSESDFTFNSGVRYSQWVTKSRMNRYYANKKENGFAVYDAQGNKISGRTDGKTTLDYVPGLVAKAIVENVQYYSQYSWAQSWALPFFYTVADYGNDFYNKYASVGGSLDDLNASKVYFGLYELTNTGGAYASNSIASTTKGNAQTALTTAKTGFINHNNSYIIANTTPAYTAGHTIVEGGWWHKNDYHNEMWLDGSYMGPALFAQLTNYNGSDIIGDDWTIVYRQIQALWEMCWNPTDKLLYHAFAAEGRDTYSNTWADFDPDNGVFHSASYWGRACGWYFLALIDILEQMDKAGLNGTDNYNTLKSHLSDLAAGLAARQDAATGCWYQILDEDGSFYADSYNNKSYSATYNYIESSASALFTAGYLKAIRLGYLSSATYETIAKKGYEGLVNNFFATDGSEGVHLFGSCRSAGLGTSSFRDGSKAYYLLGSDVSRVKKSDKVTEGKVLGGFILAATEYERLYQNNTVLFEKDLANAYVFEESGELSCPASGSGTSPTYQWYKNGTAIEGATNATLTVTTSGNYYCEATSSGKTIQSSTAAVTVTPPPTVLYSTDFSDSKWSGITDICNSSNAANETYNGITFHSYNSSAKKFTINQSAGTMTWCNNGMGDKYWIAIPVTGVNGSLTITVDNGTTATKFNYVIKQETTISGSPGSGTANSSSTADPATITIDNLDKSDCVVYLGRNSSSYTTVTSITITTPASSGGDDPTPTTYTVSYNGNGKTSGDVPSDTEGPYATGATVTVLGNTGSLAKTGYTWSGWNTAENGSGTSYSANATFSMGSSDVTLYAKWTANTYSVRFNANANDATGTMSNESFTYGTAKALTSNAFTRTGYTFAGWATSANGAKVYDDEESVSNLTATNDGTVDLYAKWTENQTPTTNYTVKFYNGETQFGDSQTIEEGSTVSAPATSPTKEGYIFKGWALSEGSTARVLFPYPVYEDVNFYAVWSNTTSGGGGEDETIFSAIPTNKLTVNKSTTVEITSDNATITGGEMYACNAYTGSDKRDMIKSTNSKVCFYFDNDNTYFKVELSNNKVLKVGDIIECSSYFSGTGTKTLWLSTNETKPSSAPTSVLSGTLSSGSANWYNILTYTVANNDGICGQNTFYIYSGNSNTCKDFTITREGQAVGNDITLDATTDYENFDDYVGEGKNVTLRRNFTEGKWTTLVLPFNVNKTQLQAAFENDSECELAKITSMNVDTQGKGSIHYITVNSIEANKPVLAKIMPNASGKYVFSGVTVVNPESVVSISTDENVEMHGVYKTTGYNQISHSAYFLYDGKFYDWSYLNAMSPFSAYILPVGENAHSVQYISFDDEATGIINVNGNGNVNSLSHREGWGESYNLAGQRVTKEYNGIVIIKGKKVFTK